MIKKYANWSGKTPSQAIGNMLEFHEGKEVAKGFRERMVEADEIIQDAFLQTKGFSNIEIANPEEYNLYLVKEIERNGVKAYQLVFKSSESNEEFIFGMDSDDSGRNKSWLDYWCLRLNRAFMNGWFGAKGVSSWPDDRYYEELDRLFNKMSKKD